MDTFAPRSEEEVREVVGWAASARATLNVQGSGSRAGFGHGVQAHHRLGLAGLTGIHSYDARELVLTAAAGTSLAEIDATLAAEGQQLAFEPPDPAVLFGTGSGGTLGGVFLANQSGPRRVIAGAARDHLLGVRAVNGRGEIWKAGGKVIKNVTGYDLARLLAGSWGTLAVVTEITCKVLPAAPCTRTVAIPAANVTDAVAVLTRIAVSPLSATGLAYVPPGCTTFPEPIRGRCLARLEGGRAGVAERARAIRALPPSAGDTIDIEPAEADDCWRNLRDGVPVAGAAVVLKLSVPPAQTPALCHWLTARGVTAWYLDCGAAWIWIGLPEVGAQELIMALRDELHGGSVMVMRAPDAIKQVVGVLSRQPDAMAALTRRIKHSFDPLSLFNPGRLYPD